MIGIIVLVAFTSLVSAAAGALIMFYQCYRRPVHCCEHNRCPDRPEPKQKYLTQPWRCPQCGTWWLAVWGSSSKLYLDWKEITDAPHEDTWTADED